MDGEHPDAPHRAVPKAGLLAIPDVAADVDLPIMAFAAGTSGLGDQCAPSRVLGGAALGLLPPGLWGQAVVVATDYEGLGTPGTAPAPEQEKTPAVSVRGSVSASSSSSAATSVLRVMRKG